MKTRRVLTFLAWLITISCSTPSSTSYPIDNLLKPANLNLFVATFPDTKVTVTQNDHLKILFDSTILRMEAFWLNEEQPVTWMNFRANARKAAYPKPDNLPDRWQTRDGVYAWITLDSLQAINGKPFYLEFDGTRYEVINWEEGKLATSGIDMSLVVEEGNEPEGFVSSQHIIDRKLKVRGELMRVWNTGWPRANQAASNGIVGDYPLASQRVLTSNDISLLDHEGLRLMRNEIFARHGYTFKDEDLSDHFAGKKWYRSHAENVDNLLTDIEQKNITLITQREDYLVTNRPITDLMRALPLLTLPIDLESKFAAKVDFPLEIEDPDGIIQSEQPWSTYATHALFGILPDTTNYYGVVWYTTTGQGSLAGIKTQIMVTTFDKNFKPISGGPVAVSHDDTRYATGECTSKVFYESTLNEDLAFFSKFTVYGGCEGDSEKPITEATVTGKINRDGVVEWKFEGEY